MSTSSVLSADLPGIPSPQQMPGTLSFLFSMVRDPVSAIPDTLYDEPIVYRSRPARLAYVTDPGLLHHVLVENRRTFSRKPGLQRYVLGSMLGNGILLAEDEDWRWQRQVTAPLFRYAEIKRYVPAMAAAAQEQIELWTRDPGGVQRIDNDMIRATFGVLARTLLPGASADVDELLHQDRFKHGRAMPWAIVYGTLHLPEWLPRPGRKIMRQRALRLRALVHRLITETRANPPEQQNLLTRLMDARDCETGQPMTDESLIDNTLTFLLAGHHTTATALTWALYLVAGAPAWRQRLLEEITSVAPEGQITADKVEQLTLCQQVIKEAMRLYPPVPQIARVAGADVTLGGVPLRAGTIIQIPIYVLHRHRALWHAPERFDPERFSFENESALPSCQFMPFGMGPRICSGAAFALVEATVLLATFLRAARFERVNGFVPQPAARVVLVSKNGMRLAVWPR